MNKRKKIMYVLIVMILLFISLILYITMSNIDKKINNSDTYTSFNSIDSNDIDNIPNNILKENSNKNNQKINDFTRKSLINDILFEISKGNYQQALDLLKSESKRYNLGQDLNFNYILNDLTMLINLKNNPEVPNDIDSNIYSKNENDIIGSSYHVKDKLPITYYNIQKFESPEICALASLHFSYEMLSFAVEDKNSYINLIGPNESVEIINYNAELSEDENNFILELKQHKNNISDFYVFEMKNIERDFCFKAYVYKEYESNKVNLYGYFFNDFKNTNNVDISTANHFIEIYSAAVEKRKIDYSKLDKNKYYSEEEIEKTAKDNFQ